MTNATRIALAIVSIVGFVCTACAITAFPTGSLSAICMALAAFGFAFNTAYLVYVQTDGFTK